MYFKCAKFYLDKPIMNGGVICFAELKLSYALDSHVGYTITHKCSNVGWIYKWARRIDGK